MAMEHLFFCILLLGLMSPILLLIFPNINYRHKSILVSLTGGFWIYISINFLAIHFVYLVKDERGMFLLLSVLHGMWVSILAAGLIMAFFIEKKKSLDRSNQKL